MATYRELIAQMAALEQQAETARMKELEGVIRDIRTRVAEYGITASDIFGARRGERDRPKPPPPRPKYRDPVTGRTWSGRGRAPAWISGVENRSRFLLKDTP